MPETLFGIWYFEGFRLMVLISTPYGGLTLRISAGSNHMWSKYGQICMLGSEPVKAQCQEHFLEFDILKGFV